MSDFRITGMSSGLDIDQIVKDSIKAEEDLRVTPYKQRKIEAEWRQEEYQSVNRDIANFLLGIKKDFGISYLSSSGVSISQSIDSFTWAKSATPSDSSILSTTARADAVNGIFSVEVKNLAKSVSKISNQDLGVNKGDSLQASFGDNFGADKILNFTINGEDFSFDTTSASLDDVVDEINSRNIGVKANFDYDTGRMSLNTEGTGSDYKIHVTADEDSFLTSADGNPTNLLKLHLQTNTEYKGEDAKVLYGDDKVEFTSTDNSVEINGVTLNLKSTGTTNISTDTDVDAIYDKIAGFVDNYNNLIDGIHKKLSEDYYRDFLPLTSEHKKELTDGEIKTWEEKARSGLLKDDDILKNMLSDMRNSLYGTVYNDYNNGEKSDVSTIYGIGITSKTYAEKGKLQIDETKLKDAIKADPEGVLNFFFKSPSSNVVKNDKDLTSDEIKEKHGESGIFNRLMNDATKGMEQIIKKAGAGEDADLLKSTKSTIMIDFATTFGSKSLLDDEIKDYNWKVENNQTKINKYETRLWKQYSALEKALAKMNSNSNMFMMG